MPKAAPIIAAPTSIAAFLGAAQRGASYRAHRVSSPTEFITRFGPLTSKLELGYAVGQFFANGGKTTRIVRLAQKASLQQRERALNALDLAPAVNLLVLPGVNAVHVCARAVTYAQRRRAFLLLDSPARANSASSMLKRILAVIIARWLGFVSLACFVGSFFCIVG